MIDPGTDWPLSADDGVWPRCASDAPGVRLAVFARPDDDLLDSEATGAGAQVEQWPILGYDIVDRWLLSGLSNCGYDSEELAELASDWRPRLTAGGLVRDLGWAVTFVEVANRRVPEHAPFYVVQLRSPDLPPRYRA